MFGGSRKDKSISERVRLVLSEQLGINHEIHDNDRVVYDLGADSLDTIEIVMALEEEFELEISDSDASELLSLGGTVHNITQYIEDHING